MNKFADFHLEQAALEHLALLGWQATNGFTITPGEPGAERKDYGH